jgi:hypothetical protein
MPDPVLLSLATAVVSKAVGGLYELVQANFADDPVATDALEAADGTAEDSPEMVELAATLGQAEVRDPEFGRRLRDASEPSPTGVTQSGHVTNQISGTVQKAVLAHDIHGGVTF